MITIISEKTALRITPQILSSLGAICIDDKYDIWQVGLLQYRRQVNGYKLWDEANDWFIQDAIPVKYLHELFLQYYGLTFKNLH